MLALYADNIALVATLMSLVHAPKKTVQAAALILPRCMQRVVRTRRLASSKKLADNPELVPKTHQPSLLIREECNSA